MRRVRRGDGTLTRVRSLVIIELTRLGDCITVLPVVRKLRQQFPDATMHVVVDALHAPLFAIIDKDIDVTGVGDSASPAGFMQALSAVRRRAPDLACSMSPSNRNAALALASGATIVVGYLRSTASLTPFLDVNPVESIGLKEEKGLTYAHENIGGRPAKVLESLDLRSGVEASAGEHDWTADMRRLDGLRSRGLINGRPFIVVHPFSRWEYRSWPVGEFATLAKMIVNGTRRDVVFVCHASEHEQLEPLLKALQGEGRVRFFPSNDLLDTAVLLREADLFVGNDSGPIHLAAYLDIPVVGLYGPATPALAAPLQARGTFLYHPVPCSPCTQRVCVMPENHCMRLITTGEVFSAIMKELSLHARSGIPANA